MKRIILFVIIIFSTTLYAQNTTTPVLQASLKIGYVDSEVILAQYAVAIKAKSDLEALVSKWRKDLDSMRTELQTSYADYQKQAQTMKQDELQKAQQKVVEKEQKAQQFQDQKFSQPNGEYFVRQEQLMAPVKKKIFEAIEIIAQKEGMKYVLDKAGDIVVLYADSEFDITFKVLDRLKTVK